MAREGRRQRSLVKIFVEQLRCYDGVAKVFKEARIVSTSEPRVEGGGPCIVNASEDVLGFCKLSY